MLVENVEAWKRIVKILCSIVRGFVDFIKYLLNLPDLENNKFIVIIWYSNLRIFS